MAMERNLQNTSPNDLEKRFGKMSEAMKLETSFPLPKIQMVANDLRERTDFKSYYDPKVVSMGPIHHGKPGLQMGEEYKILWAQCYIEGTGGNREQLYKEVADKLGDLKSHFAENVLTMASVTLGDFASVDEKLKWMLFVDGCALLYILMSAVEFDTTAEVIMKLVIRDVLLLENQLPMSLLCLLSKNNRFNLKDGILKFLSFIHSEHDVTLDIDCDKNEVKEIPDLDSAHLLHEFHRWLLPYSLLHEIGGKLMTPQQLDESFERSKNSDVRYMNIQELKSNGIRVKPNATRKLTDIHFVRNILDGELVLPQIILDDVAISTFINLTAFERCPDFDNNYGVGSFLALINSFLRQEEDVRDLRSALVLRTYGSDEEVLKLFHFIATDVMSNAYTYKGVYVEIYMQIKNKWKTNTIRFLRNIRHPWTNFAIHATELAFALALIQTWFTIHPAKS